MGEGHFSASECLQRQKRHQRLFVRSSRFCNGCKYDIAASYICRNNQPNVLCGNGSERFLSEQHAKEENREVRRRVQAILFCFSFVNRLKLCHQTLNFLAVTRSKQHRGLSPKRQVYPWQAGDTNSCGFISRTKVFLLQPEAMCCTLNVLPLFWTKAVRKESLLRQKRQTI